MVKLFSTGCPQCNVLERKLKERGINFEVADNVNEVIALGYTTAPILQVDDKYYNFGEALAWLRKDSE